MKTIFQYDDVKRFLGRRCILFCWIFLGMGRIAWAQPTNLQILDSLVTSSIEAVFNKVTSINPKSVSVEILSKDSLFVSYQRSLVRYFLQQRAGRRVDSVSEPPERYLLLLRWNDWDIIYRPIRKLFKKTRIRRSIAADFFLELWPVETPEKKIIRRVKFRRTDTVKKEDLYHLEASEYAFTGGTWEMGGRGSQFFVNAFLFAISAAVVYLFYTVRSS
jgi:hypothetical protein